MRTHRVRPCLAALAGVAVTLASAAAWAASDAPAVRTASGAIDDAQGKLVKIWGAGGFRGMEAYQSGMLISPEGHILTVWSYVLDTEYISATLNDGRRFDAKLVGADPRLEVAVLKIEAKDLPYFDLKKAVAVEGGTRVFALTNTFGVAMGNEPASVQHGTVSVLTNLAARHGIFETPYRGPVYVLDTSTNNPGSAGGALVTRRGQLAAMLGKELRNSLNNTWLNYAVPIDQLRESVESIQAGKFVASEKGPEKKSPRPVQLASLGIVLLPEVLERTPAFVDQVRPGSPAAKAGLAPDDLILLVGNHLAQSCKALRGELELLSRDEPVRLTVLRGQDLLELTLEPTDAEKKVP